MRILLAILRDFEFGSIDFRCSKTIGRNILSLSTLQSDWLRGLQKEFVISSA